MFYIWLVWPIFQLLSPAASQIPGDEGTWRQKRRRRRRLTWWTRTMSTQGQKGHPISLPIQEILKTRGTSNIFTYQRDISNRRDIKFFVLYKKYFKQEGHLISLQIHEIFPTRGTSNISSYPRNNFSKTDIEYLSPGIYSTQNFGLGTLRFCWQENWSHIAILSFREKRESATL